MLGTGLSYLTAKLIEQSMASSTLESRAQIGEVADKIRANCRYKSDAHFKAARRWARIHYALGISAVVMAAITGVSSFREAFPNKDLIIGLQSALVAVLTALITFLIPNDKANAHHVAGIKYSKLKNIARSLGGIEITFPISDQDLYEKLRSLINEVEEVDKASPLVYGLRARDFRTIKRLRSYIYSYVKKRRRSTKSK